MKLTPKILAEAKIMVNTTNYDEALEVKIWCNEHGIVTDQVLYLEKKRYRHPWNNYRLLIANGRLSWGDPLDRSFIQSVVIEWKVLKYLI